MNKMFLRRRVFLLLSALVVIGGCSHAPVAPPKVVGNRIQVIPVMPIDRLYTENKGIPVGILWQSIADRIKSNNFTDHMEDMRKAMGPKMTTALVKALSARGYEARVMEGIERPAESPDNIEYERLPGTEPVLHVYFSEVGMLSSRFSVDYVPRVNVGANLIRPKDDDYLYSETIYYGADARGDATWSVPAPSQHKWPSFDALVTQSKEVSDSYDSAMNALAEKIAANIRTQTK